MLASCAPSMVPEGPAAYKPALPRAHLSPGSTRPLARACSLTPLALPPHLPTPEPATRAADAKVVALAAGMEHSLALTAGGEVYSWGASTHGRLGHGAPASLRLFGSGAEFKPRLIRAFEALRIKQV